MKRAKVSLTFQVDNVDGKTLDEIYDDIMSRLEATGLDQDFSPLWYSTKVFDENGNLVDEDYY